MTDGSVVEVINLALNVACIVLLVIISVTLRRRTALVRQFVQEELRKEPTE